jgi:hypothetical protein
MARQWLRVATKQQGSLNEPSNPKCIVDYQSGGSAAHALINAAAERSGTVFFMLTFKITSA